MKKVILIISIILIFIILGLSTLFYFKHNSKKNESSTKQSETIKDTKEEKKMLPESTKKAIKHYEKTGEEYTNNVDKPLGYEQVSLQLDEESQSIVSIYLAIIDHKDRYTGKAFPESTLKLMEEEVNKEFKLYHLEEVSNDAFEDWLIENYPNIAYDKVNIFELLINQKESIYIVPLSNYDAYYFYSKDNKFSLLDMTNKEFCKMFSCDNLIFDAEWFNE